MTTPVNVQSQLLQGENPPGLIFSFVCSALTFPKKPNDQTSNQGMCVTWLPGSRLRL